ncbi:MAG TPA: GNAT family protein [Phycisphaerae bacterium]|nr:GNAT family protein [Phycisphaerae bacterium]
MLRGKNVALRPVEPRDVELLTSWWNDPAFIEGAAGRWPTRSQEVAKRVAKKPNYDKLGEFLIVSADTLGTDRETPLGHIAFSAPLRLPTCDCREIGFGINPDHRRRGYATQAARLLIDRLFSAQQVHRIQAHCRVENVASQRVLEGAGMTREGTLRGFAYLAGRYLDVDLYSILRPEWGDRQSYADRFGGL